MKHYFSKYIGEINLLGGMLSAELRRLVGQLDYQCSLLENAQKNGYGHELYLQEIIMLLEKLAQDADLANTGARNVLEAFWNDLPGKTPYQINQKIAYKPLEMKYDEQIPLFSVRLPPLLPYKMSKGANYLHDQVVFNIRAFHDQWYAEHGAPIRITPAVVVFIHRARHGDWRNVRDYDNLERKRVLDALQIGGMFSDNPSRMIDLNMMAWFHKSCTDIHITRLEKLHELIDSLDFSAYGTPPEKSV